jgi:hypothetical protein
MIQNNANDGITSRLHRIGRRGRPTKADDLHELLLSQRARDLIAEQRLSGTSQTKLDSRKY